MVTAGIENILVTTDIISGIIYAKNLVLKYATVFEEYLISRWLGSAARLRGTTMYRQNTGKEVTFQFRNEVLETR